MDDLSEQLAARDRFRRALYRSQTPDERMREMMRLQQATWDALLASPAGYAHFLRRNFRKRAVDAPGGENAT
jgi:hypothetical protein